MNNYCIKGNTLRGKEVIALLESKGGINVKDYHGDRETAIYYINNIDNIIHIAYTKDFIAIIPQFCEELTLPEEWKPKYKIDAEVQTVNTHQKGTIIFIDSTDKYYQVSFANSTQFWFKENEIEPYKWTPKRGELVLARNCEYVGWEEVIFSFIKTYSDGHVEYHSVGGNKWSYCIPFDENKLGKVTDD